MRTLSIIAPKGGQGCTVVSAILALTAAGRGQRVLLISDDGHAVLGVPEPLEANVPERVHTYGAGELYISTAFDHSDESFDLVISDGVNRRRSGSDDTVVMVVRNCYMALRRAVHTKALVDAYVAVIEPGRALTKGDVRAILAPPTTDVLELPWDAAIARAVDAGLLGSRLPHAAGQFGVRLADHPVPA